MQKTVGMISLGCPKNLVDSEIMLGLLEEAGYKIVTDPAKAAVLIVNTCGFIEDAKRESIETIIEMGNEKKAGHAKHLIVTGCLPQRYKEELASLFPEVDLFVGTGEYHLIARILNDLDKKFVPKKGGRGATGYIGVPEYIHTANTPRKIATPPHSVYVKIAEGCFHACSFCAIPLMRGRYRSRKASDIIKEVKRLLAGGAKEINLIAQDSTAYGRDLKGKENVVTLLENIAPLSGEKWIRLLYTYPQSFKKGIVKAMKEYKDICRYIDIPIQHIDDKILCNMRRGHSEKKVRELIEYLKTELPDVTLRTSIIAGFPGETEREHNKLLKFIEEGLFDHVGVFTYSEEEGTVAAKLPGHVTKKVKDRRKRELMKAQKRISHRKLKKWVGESLKVLVDGPSKETDHLMAGRTEFQAPDIDGVVYLTEGKIVAGEFYSVEITGSHDYDLAGRVV